MPVGGAAHMQNIPSVGQEAARLMEPGCEGVVRARACHHANYGKLQHHLGLLFHDKDGTDEELRRVSLRAELFVCLHGMLFTNIQFDNFKLVLKRFQEKLEIGVLANSVQAGRLKVLMAKCLDGDLSKMEIDDEDIDIDKSSLGIGTSEQRFNSPWNSPSECATPTLNRYNTIILTFLATVLRDQSARAALERSVPWEDLASFLLSGIPRRDILRKHRAESGIFLTSGCKPLPEDWCIRGMGGKKVFERGFWRKDSDTAGEEHNIEVEALDRVEVADQAMDGLVEDEDDGREGANAGLRIARDVHGFKFAAASPEDGRPCWRVEGALAAKVARWGEEERHARDTEEQRMRGTRWEDDSMEVDDVEGGQVDDDLSEDAEDNEEEIWRLKARRRYLQALLQAAREDHLGGRLPVVMELDSQSSNATPLARPPALPRRSLACDVASCGNYVSNLKVRAASTACFA
ncbi:hypothetical protein VTO73DRAFT_7114 [Trametes versicolor]